MCMIHHDGGGSVDAPRVKPPIQRNMVEKPEEPYFLIDVEDGRANLRKFGDRKVSFGKPRSRIISESIKGQGRFLLTYYEGVALAILSGVLSRHYIRCSGSSCGIPEFGCDLSLNHQGTPTFGYAGEDSPTSPTARWGTPSCCSWI